MLSGRALELIAGLTPALGTLPRLSSIALFVFLVPAKNNIHRRIEL
jgi:uncharacterized membrane protein YphA (DoxX/SURF4 family)